jgi:hypothetical protein
MKLIVMFVVGFVAALLIVQAPTLIAQSSTVSKAELTVLSERVKALRTNVLMVITGKDNTFPGAAKGAKQLDDIIIAVNKDTVSLDALPLKRRMIHAADYCNWVGELLAKVKQEDMNAFSLGIIVQYYDSCLQRYQAAEIELMELGVKVGIDPNTLVKIIE